MGGCVRDSILGAHAGGLGTLPHLREAGAGEGPVCVRTVDTGIRHGTVTVLMGGNGYEVTTYRIDGEYRDGPPP